MKVLAAALATLLFSAGVALAASPFGVGLPEPAPSAGGWFGGFIGMIAVQQAAFYRALTGAVEALARDGSAAPLLGGLSFLYGVLHAAGPGHGKAVISSYVLANGATARNGAVLAMLSALAQALAAIALVTIGAALLGITGVAMTETARVFEIGSYALITALGLWLVWSRVLVPARTALAPSARLSVFARAQGGAAVLAGDGGFLADSERPPRLHLHGAECGCGHIAPAATVAGRLDGPKAFAAIAAVGIRPCTGAVIVLVFALSQGVFWAGVVSVLLMAVGTGLTVAALAGLAVGARGLATRLLGRTHGVARAVARTAEACGAVAVLAFGGTLLAASLAG